MVEGGLLEDEAEEEEGVIQETISSTMQLS